jgi:hypothetical protein
VIFSDRPNPIRAVSLTPFGVISLRNILVINLAIQITLLQSGVDNLAKKFDTENKILAMKRYISSK